MPRSTLKAVLLVAAALFFSFGLPAATAWFAGVDFGYVRCTFQPVYTVPSSGEAPAQYLDRGNGGEAGITLGREWRIGPWFTIAMQGRASISSAKWQADFDMGETSHIRYDLDSAVTLSVVPALRVRPRLWLNGEVGGGFLRVHEEKTSLDYTRYDYREWVGCLLVGAGLSVELTRSLDLTLSYRYQKTRAFTYKAYLPDGRHLETIVDKPSANTVTGGVRFRF